ncbi:alpha/beta hydrolase family protein [Actinomadura macrotermitis]|uniref:Poly(ethylene terephthalate) hydrolase n=1 Tax=Actinomadura macrotermitis TaxID=2585200 RepID=A0A7K0BYW6_9ACTN|nr:phosphohydrolase [Actinomadura macrotermitis]MQY06276.1 Poly(ethylene terephthalate) hydrolase [Actinomadura macrotermitis]
MRIDLRRSLAAAPALFALTLGAAVPAAATTAAAPAGSVRAAVTEYRRGPAPTQEGIRAARGPFTYSAVKITASQAAGAFGGGTIYYPDDTTQGTYGGIAVSPGYTGPESSIAWLGPRLASQGFIVVTIATTSLYDQPTSRGRQLLAALDYLTAKSPAEVRRRLDAGRLAVSGHSMGGGGALYAAWSRPGLKAAVPLAPYNTIKDWSGITVPTLVQAGTRDTVTPVATYAEPIYQSLTGARERAYAEVSDATHLTFTAEDQLIGSLEVAWMKRFLDGDTRYDQFLCPAPADPRLTEYRDSCPTS